MTNSDPISTWLVLGPIYSPAHQSDQHSEDDGHPRAEEIITDINDNPLEPKALTNSVESAPNDGDIVIYGNEKIYPKRCYSWRQMEFRGIDWANITDVENNIHRHLVVLQV